LFLASEEQNTNPPCLVSTLKSKGEVRRNKGLEISSSVEKYRLGIDTCLAVHWMEVKEPRRGRTSTPQNMENAFRQVLMGVGGFGQEQREQRQREQRANGSKSFEVSFIPVVMTTAKLYVATYDINDIDLETGTIRGKEKVSFTTADWVLVHYGVSTALVPEVIPEKYYGINPEEIQKEYNRRSIFVVNAKYIKSFLSKLHLEK
jgi:hypothetical protein